MGTLTMKDQKHEENKIKTTRNKEKQPETHKNNE
jgi:hypothetical protein